MRQAKLSRRQFTLALGAGLLPWPMTGLTADRRPQWGAVQAALNTMVRERVAPGMAIALVFGQGATPSYVNAGHVAFDSELPFDEHSICRVYSMTKHVTKTAALLLVEDGELSLDQPVTTVLPEFANLRVLRDPMQGLESRPAERSMTMRHLLTNTSGLGNWTPGSDSGERLHQLYRERGITPGNYGSGRLRPGFAPQPETLDELVRRVADVPLAFEPGTVVHYSIGFDVMALVIERVSGKPYDAFLDDRLFRPLGMRSTGFQVGREQRSRLTTNYDAAGQPASAAKDPESTMSEAPPFPVQDDRSTSDWLAPPRPIAGGAGLLSTSRDFLRYAQMLLDDGAFGGRRIMKPETARLSTGSIDPPGVREPLAREGAGTRAMLRTPIIPKGTIGSGGAAGTLFWIDRARHGAAVFMVQAMYGGPARSPFQTRLFPALEADLATAQV